MDLKQINFELLDYFIDFLSSSSKKSQGTIENIKRDIKNYLDYLAESRLEIDEASIKTYLGILQDKYTEASFISKSSSLRQFVNWLNLDQNPFWKIRLSISMDDYQYYEKKDLEKIFMVDSYETLLVRALYELYLSFEELIGLNLADYNSAGNTIKIRNRDLKIPTELASLIKNYLKVQRTSLGSASTGLTLSDPLFVLPASGSATVERLTSSELLKILANQELKNSFLKRSRIIHLIEEGLNPDQIEDRLGIKISDFFRPFFKDQSYRLLSAYNQFHPRAKLNNKP
jgi:site-specific recombinase XerD